MPIKPFNVTFSVLALIALGGAVLLAIPATRRLLEPYVTRWALWLATLVALASTAGSLTYSEVFLFEPCRLCWYQRIAMYPLVLILGVGAWRRDRSVRWYSLPAAVAGLGLAGYHLLIQNVPALSGTTACAAGVPCSAKYVDEFGFVSIPFMAAAGFLAIIALVVVYREENP